MCYKKAKWNCLHPQYFAVCIAIINTISKEWAPDIHKYVKREGGVSRVKSVSSLQIGFLDISSRVMTFFSVQFSTNTSTDNFT